MTVEPGPTHLEFWLERPELLPIVLVGLVALGLLAIRIGQLIWHRHRYFADPRQCPDDPRRYQLVCVSCGSSTTLPLTDGHILEPRTYRLNLTTRCWYAAIILACTVGIIAWLVFSEHVRNLRIVQFGLIGLLVIVIVRVWGASYSQVWIVTDEGLSSRTWFVNAGLRWENIKRVQDFSVGRIEGGPLLSGWGVFTTLQGWWPRLLIPYNLENFEELRALILLKARPVVQLSAGEIWKRSKETRRRSES